jgi:hypothetical protein
VTNAERLALAGFLAGYSGLTRQAYELDLHQYVAWCQLRRRLLPWADQEQEFAEPLARYVLYVGPGRSVPCAAGRID